MDEILLLRDQRSRGAAACLTEHHMVWRYATFSHEHRGRSSKLAMMPSVGCATACIDYCFSIVCELIRCARSLHSDPEPGTDVLCHRGLCVFEWRSSVCITAARQPDVYMTEVPPCLLTLCHPLTPDEEDVFNWHSSECFHQRPCCDTFCLDLLLLTSIRKVKAIFVLCQRQHIWVTTSFLP